MRGSPVRPTSDPTSPWIPAIALRSFAWLTSQAQAERERWILWLPVGLGLGIAVYFELPFEPPIGAGLLVAFLALVGTIWRPLRYPALAILVAAGGFSLVTWRAEKIAAPVLQVTYGPGLVEGRIVEIARLAEGRRVVLDRVTLRDMGTQAIPVRIRINITRSSDELRVGDRIRISAILNPPPGPSAPGAFDFQRMAYFQRLGAVGFATQPPAILAREGADGPGMEIDGLRERLTTRILSILPGTPGGMAAALLTGEQTAIDKDTMQAMRDSGLAHLLSISGLHIVFVSAIVMGVVRYGLALVPWIALRWPVKKLAAIAALGAAFFYTLLAGSPVPAQRSFLMAAFVLIAILLDRTALTMLLVAWAAVVVLVIEPESLLGASFQMSFAAVVALCAAWESSRGWRNDLRLRIAGINQHLHVRVGIYVASVVFTTLIAGTATAAFSAYHFNRISLLGTVANLLAVPLTGIWVMPCGVLAMLLMPFGLEWIGLLPMAWGIEGIVAVAKTVAAWPAAAIALPSMPGFSLWLISIGGLWLCIWQNRWRWLGCILIVSGFLSIATVSAPDISVSESGRLVAIRSADGQLAMLSSPRAERFTAESWLRRSALREGEPWPRVGISADGTLRCEPAVCTWRKGLWRVSLVRSEAAVATECRKTDVLIALVPVRERCAEPRLLVDRTSYWRDGAHAISFGAHGITLETVNRYRGSRPWVPNRAGPLPGWAR